MSARASGCQLRISLSRALFIEDWVQVRIPLDYYQVLGVPMQATPEQIDQAFQDRLLQLPSHHHSPTTVATRRELIEHAYQVLREPDQRHAYDRRCRSLDTDDLIAQLDPQPVVPDLEITEQQLSGALLLLYELGDYNQVVRLGQPFLKGDPLDLSRPYTGSAAEADITLTVALAYLELGREQWQQQHYQAAATHLEAGLRILERSGLFPELQQQFQSELDRLRPYRILELLALPLSDSVGRQRGVLLLREMLSDRGGIEGRQDDRSGLGVEDFLKFILQLRAYLTATEQQELFEREARRPSAVASYLAVHALVARGFHELQPSLIRRGKDLLQRLLPNQDIYLELASCLLLLGQPAEALAALEKSQDQQSIAFIRRHSGNAPDLLPGLCYYTEQWLQEEIYPAFRDLGETPVSLDQYFADPNIQTYLDALNEELVVTPITPDEGTPPPPVTVKPSVAVPPPYRAPFPVVSLTAETLPLEAHQGSVPPPDVPSPTATVSSTSHTISPRTTTTRTQQRRTRDRRQRPRNGWLWVGGGVLLIGAGVLAQHYWFQPRLTTAPPPETPIAVATPTPVATNPSPDVPEMTIEVARDRLQAWQQIKAQALGSNFAIDNLEKILTEPALSTWRSRAQGLKSEGSYWSYTLTNLEIKEIRPLENNRVDVIAQIQEDAKFYEQGTLRSDISYNDSYRVLYTLVQDGNQWLIQRMQVLS
ncbi:IMS domain-containing protein [Parathermosynechococcus lividus]|uniref:IMS domain-containing protein n=1 Tax=Parathermosynechococcus lividus TaxID=33070 RepID=UPI001D0D8058|nr:IMS domain-containing protein [Thermostichus lividus]